MAAEAMKETHYTDHNFRKLMAEFKILSSFTQIAAWDEQAQVEVENIIIVIHALNDEIIKLTVALGKARSDHKEKAFLKRMFNDRKEEKDLTQQLQRCQELIATMEAMASEMQEAIDFSPNSIEEQKTLLKELRQRKKELQIQKREVAANMKAIRDDAHQQSVHAGQGILGYNSKTAAYQRRQIRYSKQAALGPQENAKAAIERQLLQTDRDILWAERFKD